MRCIVRDDWLTYERITQRLGDEGGWAGWSEFLGAAFIVAVERRLIDDADQVEIIRFVADARAEFSPSGSDFDPVAAETMIKSVLGRACAGSVDTHTLVEVEMVLIRKVLKDANPMSDQLDEFLAEAEGVATEWAEFEDK